MDMQDRLGERPHELARTAGMIEMNVRKQNVTDLLFAKAQVIKRGKHSRHRVCRARVHDGDALLIHYQVTGCQPGADVARIDGIDAMAHVLYERIQLHALSLRRGASDNIVTRRVECRNPPGADESYSGSLHRRLIMLERFFPIAVLTMTLLASPLAAEENQRQVSVSGIGEITLVPDRASVSMGVEMRARELRVAKDEVNKVVVDFLALAEELGIEKSDLNTSQLTIRPEYDWVAATRKRRLNGYYVARHISVALNDLEKLGPLLERATAVGINQVSGPAFTSSREDELKRVALKRAAEDARRNAEVLAMTLGATLGPVRSIQTQDVSFPRPLMQARAMGMAEDSAAAEGSYEPGEIKLTARVSAAFDLLVP